MAAFPPQAAYARDGDVEYYNIRLQRWVPATVLSWDAETNTYGIQLREDGVVKDTVPERLR